ncbi:EAL and HDOD domain-containing protein [Rugamonas sp.]|uniref:EAL and HDOD domain-containing protein n=1 Tax=Rugamonas sp. TaxID=1926287 RepID=UPI0025F36C59|nr:HDOD domain-containing protein [Rugamonas sp.]
MGFFSFLKRKSAPPATTPSAPPAAATAAAPVAAAHPVAVILVRSEIVDQRLRLCGYRFGAPSDSSRHALPEALFFDALAATGLAEFAQRRVALVPISADAVLFQRHLPVAAPHTIFVLERGHTTLDPAQLAARMSALRASGAQVALHGVTLAPADAPLLAVCEVAVLNLNEHTVAEFQNLTRQLRAAHPALKLLIGGIDSWDEQRMCAAFGGDYFMGHFLVTNDKVDPDAKIDQSRVTSIELLNLLRMDAELSDMIEVAKRDPGMTLQVLQWANAPINGQSSKVTSLHQAFMVLGRNQLYRGLTVSMFRLGGGGNRDRDEVLLEVALTRARFLELASAGSLSQVQRDELFLVGLLSLFDVLMGVSLATILDKMHLSDEIREVLLKSEGPYAPYLMLALLLERNKVERAMDVATGLGLSADSLGEIGATAFQWAQDALHHTVDG